MRIPTAAILSRAFDLPVAVSDNVIARPNVPLAREVLRLPLALGVPLGHSTRPPRHVLAALETTTMHV